jgi:hypothetical protein
VSPAKIESLTRRYRDTHFALAKWSTDLTPFVDMVQEATADLNRTAPFDLIALPNDSAERYIDARGNIHLTHNDLTWTRLPTAD